MHDNGGFVIAQSADTCKFDSMPQAAVATGSVDLVLSPRAMSNALLKYSKRPDKVHKQRIINDPYTEESQFSEILILLNNRFDLDFSHYKPSTITRRLERRLTARKLSSLKDCIDVLLSNRDELEALYFDLLIGVTEFFRDKEAFASLRTSIGRLLSDLKTDEELRIWSLGCATDCHHSSLCMTVGSTQPT